MQKTNEEEKDHNAALAEGVTARSASASDAATARHTPTPWSLAPYSDRDEVINVVSEYRADGTRQIANWIAECDASVDFDSDVEDVIAVNRANAEFIVRACNSHDVLLQALKDVEKHHVMLNGCVYRNEERSTTLRIVRAAIAKAEGR